MAFVDQQTLETLSCILNTVFVEGCRITLQHGGIRIVFGVRDGQAEVADVLVQNAKLDELCDRALQYADQAAALQILACFGFQAVRLDDGNKYMLQHGEQFFDLTLQEYVEV